MRVFGFRTCSKSEKRREVNKMKRKIILKSVLCALVALASILVLAACTSNADKKTEIISIEIKNDKLTARLNATVDSQYVESHSGQELYLISLPTPYVEDIGADADVIGSARVASSVTFNFSLRDSNGFSRLSKAFVLAEKSGSSYVAVTEAAYIKNPEMLSQGKIDKAATSGIKGIASADLYESEYLGAEHILIKISMGDFILEGYESGAVPFNHNGVTYFYDKDEVDALDAIICDANDLGQRVYLRTVLTYPEKNEDGEYEREPFDLLYCDGIREGAAGYLPDMENEIAARYIRAFYAFLGSRYTGECGKVADYIVGEQVNAYSEYCNAGSLEAEKIEKLYYAWMRTAFQTVRTQNSNADVYVSVNNQWRTAQGGVIGSAAFLSHLAESADVGGGFAYSVALNLGQGEDINSLLSGSGAGYEGIGIENLEMFTKFMDSAEMRWGGQRRNVIIDGLALSSSHSEENRAAYFTAAYYRAAKLGFKSLIYSDCDEGCSLEKADGKRGDMYVAYLLCGSSINSQLEKYTEKLEHIEIPALDSHVSRKLVYEQAGTTEIEQSVYKNKRTFPVGLHTFFAAGTTYNAQLLANEGANGAIYRTLLVEADTSRGMGAVTSFTVPAKEVMTAGYVGITMSSETSPKVALIITEKGGSAAYVGEVETVNAEATYYFHISDFTKEIKSTDELTVSICVLPESDGDISSVEIRDIALYGSSGNGIQTVIIISAVAVALAGCGVLVFFLVRNRKKKLSAQSEDGGEDEE